MSIKEYFFLNKNKLLTLIVLILIITTSTILYRYYKKELNHSKKIEKTYKVLEKKKEIKSEKPKQLLAEIKKYTFDIKGEVNKPGVYSIEEGKRIIDAIQIAGGLNKRASTELINLSSKIYDGMLIYIASKDEVLIEKELILKEKLDKINKNSNKKKEENKPKININHAREEELKNIPYIGNKYLDIITYRKQHPFKSIDELKNIKGIKDATIDKIKEIITL